MPKLWRDVVLSIERLSDSNCYEKVNKFMSLLSVDRLRKELVRQVDGETVVDAGSGPGGLSLIACREMRSLKRLILLDPSPAMMMKGLRLLSPRCGERGVRIQGTLGIFENLPLKSSSIDSVMTAFAFRDAINYERAIDEFWRVLKPGGILGILDLFKPENVFVKNVVKGYVSVFPMMGSILLGCSRHFKSYILLGKTIERMLTGRELVSILRKRFDLVKFKSFYPGVGLWIARKRSEF